MHDNDNNQFRENYNKDHHQSSNNNNSNNQFNGNPYIFSQNKRKKKSNL